MVVAVNTLVVPAYACQEKVKVFPPKSNMFPGTLKLPVSVIGEVPYNVKLLVKFNPLPLPANDKLFNFLFVGIAASSELTRAVVAGAK